MRAARKLGAIFLCVIGAGLLAGALDAAAYRAPLQSEAGGEEWLRASQVPDGQIEGACGVAVHPTTDEILVSDYYHRAVRSFSAAGLYTGSFLLAGGNPPPPTEPINELNSVCGLAVDPGGSFYASEFHQRVLRFPGEAVIDPGKSTGIAVDAEGDLYVDHRTYVAVYEAPVGPGDLPASKIGVGSLENAYGVAVDSQSGQVYVPDAGDGTVKIFDPAKDPAVPQGALEQPSGGFGSLIDASLTVDESPTEGKGHVLLVDDLEPGFEFPQTAVYEFSPSGTLLERLGVRKVGPVGARHDGPIFGEPSGIAVDPGDGDVFVTTGNSEDANVVKYGPFEAQAPPSALAGGGTPIAAASAAAQATRGAPRPGGAAASVVKQQGGVRVSFDGKLTPHTLPRHGTAPVGILVDAKIGAAGGEDPPQLRKIKIAINRHGHFSSKGLPACRVEQIQPSTTENALAACGRSLVGEGRFSANVKLPQQSPFPSSGKVLAFNGKVNGRPAILAHIYGTDPVPTSTVLSFLMRGGQGKYGTTLEASLPQATGSWGYVTGLKMNLHRRFSYRGRSRSFLSAGCPAPSGLSSVPFALAKTSFAFAGDLKIAAVLNRTCKARG
ncbi:MAG TPA: hypothetical protein VJQ84_08760 [Solirubrobacterales bacterium]|nr:hypothetical protein [Solirubrobacterales bacterium]